MAANVTKLEDNKVRLDVEVPPEAVRAGVEAKVRELGRQVRVPGFRPGKAPRRVIENHLGRDYIYYEALQERLPTWYSEAVVETDLRPIDRPEIHFDDPLDEEEGFRFSATVEVRPEATLGDYKGVEVPRREVEISDEDVEEQLEELRNQFGVTFPLDYAEESLRGESVLFNVHVKEIKERDLPPLDDEFVKEASEFETLDELRAAVREQLEAAAEQRVDGEFRGRVLDVVAEGAEVEVPGVMVHEKAHEMVDSFERSIRSQGMEPEQYYQLAGTNHAEFEQRVSPDAEDTVKKELVLDAIAAAENITADEEEVMHEIGHLAEDSERNPEDIAGVMRANGTYSMLEEEISRQKALDFLVENATPVEMPEEEEAEEVEEVDEDIAEEETPQEETAEESVEATAVATENDEREE